ncbi:methylmalonyl-CoA mutase family protein [Haloglomus litoreum]|uniref:methylmalonyl-CoA mutase family protein n=1 Tax=Haloglomus litoreum TaxID=3034026 RepID=UPI0023E8DC09|nr:methylmalonyl-CoA mutase family protein [Haloglomus sp. DT116]
MSGDEDWHERYRAATDRVPEREGTFESASGLPYEPLYTADDVAADPERDIGYPGEFPYTRGPYTTMYRGRPWTRRNIICFRTVEATNERLRTFLDRGQTGVSYGGDNPTFRGFDTADVDRELVGQTGAMIDSLADHRIAMDGIPIGEVSCALGDVSPHELVAMHVALADERGVAREALAGTTMHSDYLNKLVGARMFTRFPQEAHRRLFRDHLEYVLEHLPKWNPVSLTGQNIQQAGATPAQEAAFTIAAGIEYLEEAVDLGFDPDDCAERFTFFFNVSMNLFEEVAKLRAARRVWARELTDRFDVAPEHARLRCHCQTDGQELTSARPTNNVSRVAIQALAAVLGGTQSLHTDAYDEPFRAPSEEAATIAMDTQHVLLEETDAADVIDPLGGSYFVESLTDDLADRIREYLDRIEEYGGYYEAVAEGYPQRVVREEAREYQRKVEQGEVVRVGENRYVDGDDGTAEPPQLTVPDEEVDRQIARTERVRAERDEAAATAAIEAIETAARGDENVFERVVEAVAAGVTVGEVTGALWEVFGDVEATASYAKH